MPIPDYNELIYYYGSCLRIIFAVTNNGIIHARDYIESIDRSNWGKLDRILKRLGDHGRIINIEQFRAVGDGLFEVKGGKNRLVGYFITAHFVLTNGFEKRGGGKKEKFPKNQRIKALSIKKEFDVIFNKSRGKK
ncbi:MAG: hypothetical protein R6W88_08835 [Desulfobacterales bacterium]